MTLPLIAPYGTFPLVLQPPYQLGGARTIALAVEPSMDGIERLVASAFDWAKEHVIVRPLWLDWLCGVLVVFSDYADGSAAAPATGSFAYREMTVFVPVKVSTPGTDVDTVALYVPYIYPDLVLPLAAGQAVYGLPKKPAMLAVPRREELIDGAPILADVFAAETLESSWERRTLLRAVVTNRAEDEPPVEAAPGRGDRIRELLSAPIVCLKQLVDAGSPPDGVGLASLYRAVVMLKAPIEDISMFDPLPLLTRKVDLRVTPLATDPMSMVLGEHPKVWFGGTFTMSFRFEPGEVLHEEHARPARLTR